MRRILKAVGIGVAALAASLALFMGVAWFAAERALSAVRPRPALGLAVDGSAAQVERGRHLAATRGCAGCHGADFGGRVIKEAPGLGRLAAPNLTPAGALAAWKDEDIAHAIRRGVRPDGRALLYMPVGDYAGLSDEDVASLVAYVRARPPVAREVPPSAAGFGVRALWLLGRVPMVPADELAEADAPRQAPLAAITPEYGRYVAQTCTGCHRADFAGGPLPGVAAAPVAANLTPSALAAWSEADFLRAMREGVRPDGRALDASMPWRTMGRMDDVELRAIYAYLQTLPPVAR